MMQKLALTICSAVMLCSGVIIGQPSTPSPNPLPKIPPNETNKITFIPGTKVMADAWIYPDDQHSFKKLEEVGRVQAVKIEFLHVEDDGSLHEIIANEESPNGYSLQNVALIKQHSNQQFVTISGMMDGTSAAMEDSDTIPTIVAMAQKTGFNIELDWEGYGAWTSEYYQQYKKFVGDLRKSLNTKGKKLAIDGPPIPDQASQNWYEWKYEELTPLVDQIVMMVYDNHYDHGPGAAIAPKQWSLDCMEWLKQKSGTKKGVVGVASHGYAGNRIDGQIQTNTSNFVARRAQGVTSSRTADGELLAARPSWYFVYADERTMQTRLEQVQQSGFNRLSVWSLGSNPWFY